MFNNSNSSDNDDTTNNNNDDSNHICKEILHWSLLGPNYPIKEFLSLPILTVVTISAGIWLMYFIFLLVNMFNNIYD